MDIKSISTEAAPKAIGPYSQAVIVDKFLYISGQIPINPKTGEVVNRDIAVQTRQSLDNLKAILKSVGADMKNVVKTTVFITDINNFTAFNEVYGEYFEKSYPARSLVEVSKLPKDVMVEIEAVAVI